MGNYGEVRIVLPEQLLTIRLKESTARDLSARQPGAGVGTKPTPKDSFAAITKLRTMEVVLSQGFARRRRDFGAGRQCAEDIRGGVGGE